MPSRASSKAAYLTVLSPPAPMEQAAETVAQRVQRLQSEARGLARQQVAELEAKLNEAVALALEIADGGEAYPVGARELARRLATETPFVVKNFEAILHKA